TSSSPAWPEPREMPDDLRVNGWLVIPGSELHERFSRSSGPGGQSVNTADSRVELSFDVDRSPALPEWARATIPERLARRPAAPTRAARAPARRGGAAGRPALLGAAGAPPQRPRVPTRPSRGANERRLEAKRNRAAVKRGRRPDRRDPE